MAVDVHEIILESNGKEVAHLRMSEQEYDTVVNAALSEFFEAVIRDALEKYEEALDLKTPTLLRTPPWA